jgi:glycosyltransferase involved in cell wall biosynthesis
VEQKEKIRNEKVNIVTHHWSNNFLKGFDIYEKLDDMILHDNKFTFTYIGRHRNTFKNTKIIQPLLGQELLKELKKYDVYVTASRYDPGPNHVIEAVACNLPIFVHKDGGGAVEFGKSKNNENIFENYDDLYKMLNDSKYYKSKNNFVDWEVCLLKLNEIIKSNF